MENKLIYGIYYSNSLILSINYIIFLIILENLKQSQIRRNQISVKRNMVLALSFHFMHYLQKNQKLIFIFQLIIHFFLIIIILNLYYVSIHNLNYVEYEVFINYLIFLDHKKSKNIQNNLQSHDLKSINLLYLYIIYIY